jgi:hypothetical protein
MNATSQRQASKKVQTVLRVSEEGRYAGDILLGGDNRVWRHARTVPADVVLRVLLSFTRGEEVCGQLVRRSDGRTYHWFAVGLVPAEDEAESDGDDGWKAAG